MPEETYIVFCPACEWYTLFGYKRCPNCNANIESEDGMTVDEFMHPERYEDEQLDS